VSWDQLRLHSETLAQEKVAMTNMLGSAGPRTKCLLHPSHCTQKL
jgi:hypothetical protein